MMILFVVKLELSSEKVHETAFGAFGDGLVLIHVYPICASCTYQDPSFCRSS